MIKMIFSEGGGIQRSENLNFKALRQALISALASEVEAFSATATCLGIRVGKLKPSGHQFV